MTANDLLRELAQITGKADVTLSPGPFEIKCNTQDAMAAELLLWIVDKWPDLKMGEMADVLNAAIWWDTFFAASPGIEDRDSRVSP